MKLKSLSALFLIASLSACATAHHSNVADVAVSAKNETEQRLPASAPRHKLGIANCLKLGNTVDIFSCLDATYESEDKKLQDNYDSLTELLKAKEPSRYASARTAELAWIRLRDADCTYDASADGAGEAAGAAEQICKIKVTIERRANLEFKLNELKRHLKEVSE